MKRLGGLIVSSITILQQPQSALPSCVYIVAIGHTYVSTKTFLEDFGVAVKLFNLIIPCGPAAGKEGKFENRRFSR